MVADAGRDLARRLSEGPVWLDRFELQAELGIGSFGYVFRARDSDQERVVAPQGPACRHICNGRREAAIPARGGIRSSEASGHRRHL